MQLECQAFEPPFQDVYKTFEESYRPLLVYRSSGYSEGAVIHHERSGMPAPPASGGRGGLCQPLPAPYSLALRRASRNSSLVTAHPACRVVFRVASPEGVNVHTASGASVASMSGCDVVASHLKHHISPHDQVVQRFPR